MVGYGPSRKEVDRSAAPEERSAAPEDRGAAPEDRGVANEKAHNAAMEEQRATLDAARRVALDEQRAISARSVAVLEVCISNLKDFVVQRIANQLRFYRQGHFMKIDTSTLSVPAVLSEGFVVRNLIDVLLYLNPTVTAESVLQYVASVSADMELVGAFGIRINVRWA